MMPMSHTAELLNTFPDNSMKQMYKSTTIKQSHVDVFQLGGSDF